MLEFKPLKQKRGSILLIVVSMMSVLIMLAQALLLSVSVTQQTQVTNFYDKQAYQTSLSVTDIVAATLMSGDSKSQDILKNLEKPGDTLSTGPNGFSALGAVGGAEQLNKVGAYRVDITRKNDTKNGSGDTLEVYEIAVLTDFNGMKETVTSTIYVKVTKDKFVGFDRMFTATGYATGDVFINNSVIMNPAYFDNEYTVVSGDSGSPITYSNVICGGTLQIETATFMPSENTGPRDIVVRNNFIISRKSTELFMYGGQIFIGGDLISDKDIKIDKKESKVEVSPILSDDGTVLIDSTKRTTSVYILGDVDVGATLDINAENVFINGNLKCKKLSGNYTNIYVNGSLYVNETSAFNNSNVVYSGDILNYDGTGTPSLSSCTKETGAWAKAGSVPIVKSENNQLVYHTMDNGTALNVSPQNIWDLINTLTAERVYPKFSPSDKMTDLKTEKVTLSDGETAFVIDSQEEHKNYDGVIIEDIDFTEFKTSQGTGDSALTELVPTIIINSDKVDNKGNKVPFVVKLEANTKINESDAFMWSGENGYGNKDNPQRTVNVIITGSSPVFFEIADGVKYVANDNDFLGQKDWYYMLDDAKQGNKKYVNIEETNLKNSHSTKLNNTKFENNAPQVKNFLDLAYTKEEAKAKGDEKLEGTVNPEKFKKGIYSGASDEIHNNIYLISDSEYADIDLNAPMSFFGGFVYAPYMTFKTIGGNADGQGIAVAGGLIVSDYILDDKRGYMFFKPSIDITELFDEYLTPITKREWKKASYG